MCQSVDLYPLVDERLFCLLVRLGVVVDIWSHDICMAVDQPPKAQGEYPSMLSSGFGGPTHSVVCIHVARNEANELIR